MLYIIIKQIMTEIKKHIGYIYKIVVDDIHMIYVGSTRNIRQRKYLHKSHLKLRCEKPLSKKLIELGITVDNFTKRVDLVWIEDCYFNERHELTAKEKHWIEELKPCGNVSLPYGLPLKEGIAQRRRERYAQNPQKYKDKSKAFYHKNKDRLLDRLRKTSKEYYHQNKEKCAKYQQEYRKNNLDKIKEYQAQYRKEKKEEKEQFKQRIVNLLRAKDSCGNN